MSFHAQNSELTMEYQKRNTIFGCIDNRVICLPNITTSLYNPSVVNIVHTRFCKESTVMENSSKSISAVGDVKSMYTFIVVVNIKFLQLVCLHTYQSQKLHGTITFINFTGETFHDDEFTELFHRVLIHLSAC